LAYLALFGSMFFGPFGAFGLVQVALIHFHLPVKAAVFSYGRFFLTIKEMFGIKEASPDCL
jgi:hypothetical protein